MRLLMVLVLSAACLSSAASAQPARADISKMQSILQRLQQSVADLKQAPACQKARRGCLAKVIDAESELPRIESALADAQLCGEDDAECRERAFAEVQRQLLVFTRKLSSVDFIPDAAPSPPSAPVRDI